MLSISNPIKGARGADYYLHLSSEEYYLNGHCEQPEWDGNGATKELVDDQFEPEIFRNLLNGFSKDGSKKLVQNAGDSRRWMGWDCTLSAPKSVSVLWALADTNDRDQIKKAHQVAVRRALSLLESKWCVTRRGRGGKAKERAFAIFASFFHSESRALDPQIHTHSILINLAIRNDGTTGSIHSIDFFRAKMQIGAAYQTFLSEELSRRFALAVEVTNGECVVTGVPHGLCEVFSKRRRAIVESLSERGERGAIAAKTATKRTRNEKLFVPQSILFERWAVEAQAFGWGKSEAKVLLSGTGEDKSPTNQQTPERVEEGKSDSQERRKSEARTQKSDLSHQNSRPKSQEGPKVDEVLRKPRESYERPPLSKWVMFESAGAPFDGRARKKNEKASERDSHSSNAQNDTHRTSFSRKSSKADMSKSSGIHWEHKYLFPKAPFWSPFKNLTLPVLVCGTARRGEKWGAVVWQNDTLVEGLRVQQRYAFANASSWNPLKNLATPQLRKVLLPTEAKVILRKSIGPVSINVVSTPLFSKAPQWSPARKIKIPVIVAGRSQSHAQTH